VDPGLRRGDEFFLFWIGAPSSHPIVIALICWHLLGLKPDPAETLVASHGHSRT
jgi:hypothetical protein